MKVRENFNKRGKPRILAGLFIDTPRRVLFLIDQAYEPY
tara:strand:- start:6799 stop:6915 length:117 start_codon:yes stop_codon:yes gene_type:complete